MRASASAWPKRRSAISTKRGFALPASCNGCTRRRAWPSPSIAPVKSAARSLRICKGAWSCMTTSCLIVGSTRSTTPSATPISFLRELQSLIEFDKEPWVEGMRDMLREANLAVNKARKAGVTALAPDELAAFVDRYWAAVRLGLAFHRELPKLETKANPRGRTKQRPGHNLLERLKTFKTETLRFLTDLDRKSTRLNSSHTVISYAVFCLKKKKK